MTDTPETDGMVEQCYRQINVPTNPIPADFARKLERERDELREDLEFRRGLYALQTEALEKAREERDEARETSWFSNGIEYRKRNDYIEARNNLNPHWVVVDSPTNQKP